MKVKLTVPTTLEEITLDQWMRYTAMAKDIEDEVFLAEKTVEILCDIPLDTVRKMAYDSVVEVGQVLTKAFEEKPKFKERFKMEGKEYGIIPSLDNITFGEYVDLDTYLTDENNLHKAMAVLYRPISQKVSDQYLIEEYDPGRQSTMKRMPVGTALGAVSFFLLLKQELLKNTQSYLMKETQQLTRQQRLALERNGAGINQSMLLLEATLQNLTK